MSSTSQSTSQSTPSTSSKHIDIGSSSRNPFKRTPRHEVTQIYQRGRKLVFTPHIVDGAKITSEEQGSQSQHEETLQDEEPFHINTDMVDLNVSEKHKIVDQVIMEKYAEIKELKESFSKANFMISFLEQENQLLLSKHKVDVRK